MKKLILFIFSSIYILPCFSQTTHTFSGRISDEVSGESLSLVTVVIKDTSDTFIEGTSTDNEGRFTLDLAKGSYQVTYSYIGYEELIRPLILQSDTSLRIQLNSAALNMEEIVVQGERSSTTYLVDRKVINVGKDLQAIGGDASEVLQQLAEVQTTSEGEVMLRGSNNVNILINGKPSPLSSAEVLRQISAQEMVKVELITTPSAKHRADGLTGIINIITKRKNKVGWTGSVNGRINNYGQFNSGLQLAYGSPKLNVGLSGNYGHSWNRTQRSRERIGGAFPYSQIGESEFDGRVRSLKGNLDWFVDAKNELSLAIDYTNNSHDIPATVNGTEQTKTGTTNPFSFASFNTHQHLTSEYNLNYRTYFSDKSNFLEFDFHLSDNNNALPAIFTLPGDTSQNNIDYATRIANVAIDWEQTLSRLEAKWEMGILWTNKEVDNVQTFKADVSQVESRTTAFIYTENTLAAYGLLKKNWQKWQLQLGLRWEWYENDGAFTPAQTFNTQSFQNFFPSFHLNYSFSDDLTVNLAYNRRISRPNLYQVNPFTNSNDRYFQRAGNPNLLPEFSQNVEMSTRLLQKIWSFTPTVFFRAKTNLLLSSYVFNETDQRTYLQFINEGKSDAYGIEGALAFFPSSFSRTSINANYYLEQLSAVQNDFGAIQLTRFNLTMKQLFNIGKRWQLDLSWFYWGDTQSRFSFYEARNKMDIAASVKIWKKQATVSVRLTDVFNTLQYENSLEGIDFREISYRKSLTRVAYLSFSYRFEQGEKGQRRNRKKRSFNEPGSRE